jgi:putative acetyltransferase
VDCGGRRNILGSRNIDTTRSETPLPHHDIPRFDEVLGQDPAVDALMAAHVALMQSQSPAESCHVMTAEALRSSGARVFAGRDSTGQVVAIGAFKPLGEGAVELKSMHCAAALRGQGLGRALLAHLRTEARAAGFRTLWLETGSGPEFAAARSLYRSEGFADCAPFGGYAADPLSVFMTCTL